MMGIEMMKPLHHTGTQKIQTARLILRQFKCGDYKDMSEWASNLELYDIYPIVHMTHWKSAKI